MKYNKRWTTIHTLKLQRMWDERYSIAAIAAELGVTPRTVFKHRKKLNLPARARPARQERTEGQRLSFANTVILRVNNEQKEHLKLQPSINQYIRNLIEADMREQSNAGPDKSPTTLHLAPIGCGVHSDH